jgi:hypothetical protein
MSVASEEGSFWSRACELVVMRSCVPTSPLRRICIASGMVTRRPASKTMAPHRGLREQRPILVSSYDGLVITHLSSNQTKQGRRLRSQRKQMMH